MAAAEKFGALRSLPDEDTVRARVQTLLSEMGLTVLARLRTAVNEHQYQEAALFLVLPREDFSLRFDFKSNEARLWTEVTTIVSNDLDGTDTMRQRWSLRTLAVTPLRHHVQFTDARRALLMGLLDAPSDQSVPALDILFAIGVTSDLLSRCWAVLRHPDHPLTDAVREQLDNVTEIKGNRPLLVLLDEGRRDPALRTVTLELLRKVSWQGTHTFAQALIWLADEDAEVRHLAALLLADQNDPLAVPRTVLTEATQKLATKTDDWVKLGEEAPVIRLLGGLWLNGWDEGLTQLWVAQPAVQYVNKHPSKYWRDFRAYPQSEDGIRWLLEKAAFGHSLIPTFRHAALRLAGLEGDASQGAPRAEHIATVQQEIVQHLDAVLMRADTPPLLAAEATILATTVRGEASTVPTLQALLEGTNDKDWLAALARLGQRSELNLWLRTLFTAENDLRFAAYIRQSLAAHGLTPNASPAALVGLLTTENTDARLAASLALIAADLPALLVEVLIETVQSLDDRVRMKGDLLLRSVASKLNTDGSTAAVEKITNFYWRINQNPEASGSLLTGAYNVALNLEHQYPFWINRWLAIIAQDENSATQAFRILCTATKLSSTVLDSLCLILRSPLSAPVIRRAVAWTIGEVLRNVPEQRGNEVIFTTLIQTLAAAPDIELRRIIVDALRWIDGQNAWETAQGLLLTAQTDAAVAVRRLALWSLGRVLHTARGNKETDISREAVLHWLTTRVQKEDLPREIGQIVARLPQLPALRDVTDGEALLTRLNDPADLGGEIPLADSAKEKWRTLLNAAILEWENRAFWRERLPNSPKMIEEIKDFLTAPDHGMRRDAACALAYIFHDDEDRPDKLQALGAGLRRNDRPP